MNNPFRWTSVVSQGSPESPLHVHIPYLEQLLSKQGYAKSTIQEKIQALVDFDQWLQRRILLFLARLGLRAGEVVHVTLDDIHWDTGEFVVKGKGGCEDRLPLSRDVGQALATYLRHGRPRCSSQGEKTADVHPKRESSTKTTRPIVLSCADPCVVLDPATEPGTCVPF
jgi:site-specific recombinase XerD